MDSAYNRNYNSLSRYYGVRRETHSRYTGSQPASYDLSVAPPTMSYTARKYSSPVAAATVASAARRKSLILTRSGSLEKEIGLGRRDRHSLERSELASTLKSYSSSSSLTASPMALTSAPRRESYYDSSLDLSSSSRHCSPLRSAASSRSLKYKRQNSADLLLSYSPLSMNVMSVGLVNAGSSSSALERRIQAASKENLTSSEVATRLKRPFRRTLSLEYLEDHRGEEGGFSHRLHFGSTSKPPYRYKEGWETPPGPPSRMRERSPSILSINEGLAKVNAALERYVDSPSNMKDASLANSSLTFGGVAFSSGVAPSSGVATFGDQTHHRGISAASFTTFTSPSYCPSTPSASSAGVLGYPDVRAALGYVPPRSKSSSVRKRIQRASNLRRRISDNFDMRRELIASTDISDKMAEARLAQRRAARAEARELRLRELEKQQLDQDDEDEQQYAANAASPPADKKLQTAAPSPPRTNAPFISKASPRGTPSARASAGRSSLANSTGSGGQFSRRSSEDSTPDDALPLSTREIKAELKELEEKFRKAMITNAQLDNEKATLTYEVEFLKDKYSDLDESHNQLTKEHRKKCSENETLRKVTNKLKEEVKMIRKVLQERDSLIQEYGLVLIGEENGEENFDEHDEEMDDETINDLSPRKIGVKKALLSTEASELLSKGAAQGSLDVRLRKYAECKNDLEDEVRRLKLELEEELSKRRKENGLDYEKQKEASKSINEYKFRVQKAEAEVSTLQANVARLESLVSRYKASTEELEKSEEDLKSEKRKLQRELREAQNRLEELELTTSHLQKRFDKLKTARSTLLKDLSLDPV